MGEKGLLVKPVHSQVRNCKLHYKIWIKHSRIIPQFYHICARSEHIFYYRFGVGAIRYSQQCDLDQSPITGGECSISNRCYN